MAYTWGYIKESVLSKLDYDEDTANQLGLLSKFPYFANEAMTQICSSVKPYNTHWVIKITKAGTILTAPVDFVAFSDDVVVLDDRETNDDSIIYRGYNQVIFIYTGTYTVPYKARWFFFTKDLQNDTVISAPADVLDAITSYIASQCLKIDDEEKASILRNEYEIFLARMDDTDFKRQRTLHIRGGW